VLLVLFHNFFSETFLILSSTERDMINKLLAIIRFSSERIVIFRMKNLIMVYSGRNMSFLSSSNKNQLDVWSSGQSFWLQMQRSRVRSPALPDFLSSSESGTGSTQPREPREVN